MDVGSSEKWSKAPPCCWSPIPPPELRGEPLEELSTNGGFVTFGTIYFSVNVSYNKFKSMYVCISKESISLC